MFFVSLIFVVIANILTTIGITLLWANKRRDEDEFMTSNMEAFVKSNMKNAGVFLIVAGLVIGLSALLFSFVGYIIGFIISAIAIISKLYKANIEA